MSTRTPIILKEGLQLVKNIKHATRTRIRRIQVSPLDVRFYFNIYSYSAEEGNIFYFQDFSSVPYMPSIILQIILYSFGEALVFLKSVFLCTFDLLMSYIGYVVSFHLKKLESENFNSISMTSKQYSEYIYSRRVYLISWKKKVK